MTATATAMAAMAASAATAPATASAATRTAGAPSRASRTREATDRKILTAAMGIAMQRGIAAVTIEEVARRSGVAKTTIYRRYSNTNDLLCGLRTLGVPDAPTIETMPPTRRNLEALLRAIVERFRSGIGVKAVGMVLASDDEFFRHVVDDVIRPEQERCEVFLRDGVRTGAFREGVDVRFLFDTALGSMVACEALGGGVDDAWPARMAELIWSAIAA